MFFSIGCTGKCPQHVRPSVLGNDIWEAEEEQELYSRGKDVSISTPHAAFAAVSRSVEVHRPTKASASSVLSLKLT